MKQLAVEYGVHRVTIRTWLERMSIPARRCGLEHADHHKVIRLYQDGWSLARLAEKFGCSDGTVQLVLEKAGVPRRKPWERS